MNEEYKDLHHPDDNDGMCDFVDEVIEQNVDDDDCMNDSTMMMMLSDCGDDCGQSCDNDCQTRSRDDCLGQMV